MKKGSINYGLLLIVVLMLIFGTIMVFSASFPSAYQSYGDERYYLWRQLTNLAVGAVFMIVFSMIPYFKLKKWTKPLMLVATMLLLVTPFIGISVNGARRWLGVGPLRFQPSEVMKIAIILFFSAAFSSKKHNIRDFKHGVLPYLGIIGFVAILMMLQPHMSGTIVIAFAGFLIIFLAGAKLGPFVIMGSVALCAAGAFILTSPYRMQRVLTFLDPFNNVQGEGWQIVNSLYAIGSGGLGGVGIGKSLQKFMYIPEPHNDFIMSIIAEELGFVGVLMVIGLFVAFTIMGCKIALNAADKFGTLVASGITGIIAFQAVINIAVVTSSMPVTGMPLPFFSYGGTSLVFLMSSIGILLNISKYSKVKEKIAKA